VLPHGRRKTLHLLAGCRPRRDGLAVTVVVGVHLGGREAERSLGERCVQRRLHGVDIVRRGGSSDGTLTHDQPPQRGMAHEKPGVHRDAAIEASQPVSERAPVPGHAGPQRGQRHALDPRHHPRDVVDVLGRHRRQRKAAVATEHGRHAVQGRRAGIGIPEELGVVVSVQVDEAGGHDKPGGVDDLGGVRAVQVPRHRGDLPVLDTDVGFAAGQVTAVDQGAAGDDGVECGGHVFGASVLV
jgi:hypothetical protein